MSCEYARKGALCRVDAWQGERGDGRWEAAIPQEALAQLLCSHVGRWEMDRKRECLCVLRGVCVGVAGKSIM